MKSLPHTLSLLCMLPSLLLANPESPATGSMPLLSGSTSQAAQTAPMTESSRYVEYTVGSPQDELTVRFPVCPGTNLEEIHSGDVQLAMCLDPECGGFYVVQCMSLNEEQYQEARDHLLDPKDDDDEEEDYTITRLEHRIEDREGVLHCWITSTPSSIEMALSGDKATDTIARWHAILTPEHLFFVIASGSTKVLEENGVMSAKADEFLQNVTHRY